ncbi:YraN family protein [Rathayibacter sp. CAU 1779]
MAKKDELGRRGEDLAARYLRQQGYRILARNWRCAQGEIDIVAEKAGAVAVVEVKTRSSTLFGHPFDAITPIKAARLRRLAAQWCDETGRGAGGLRIDAVAVLAPPGLADSQVLIEHLVGVC